MTESVGIVVLLAKKKQDQAETLSDTNIQSENNKLARIELTVWDSTMLRIIISPLGGSLCLSPSHGTEMLWTLLTSFFRSWRHLTTWRIHVPRKMLVVSLYEQALNPLLLTNLSLLRTSGVSSIWGGDCSQHPLLRLSWLG